MFVTVWSFCYFDILSRELEDTSPTDRPLSETKPEIIQLGLKYVCILEISCGPISPSYMLFLFPFPPNYDSRFQLASKYTSYVAVEERTEAIEEAMVTQNITAPTATPTPNSSSSSSPPSSLSSHSSPQSASRRRSSDKITRVQNQLDEVNSVMSQSIGKGCFPLIIQSSISSGNQFYGLLISSLFSATLLPTF